MAVNGTSNKTGLPHGMVPFHQLTDPQTRDAVMKLNENIAWLAKRPAGGGSAEPVVQYKDAQNLLNSIEANYPNAAEAANAIQQTISAKNAATSAAGSAAASEAAASASEASASESAETATAAATAAARSAEQSSGLAGSANFVNVDLGTTARQTIYMGSLVDDTDKTYRVKVTFRNEAATARAPTVTEGGETHTLSLANSIGAMVHWSFTIAGNGSFGVDNIANTVQVFIKAWYVPTLQEEE